MASKKMFVTLRWISFIPAAFIGAWLAWLVIFYLNQITMSIRGIDTNDFLPRLTIEILSHSVMGGFFVYIGSHVAPNHRKVVTYLLTAFILLIAGFLAFPAVIQRDWWAILGAIAVSFGAGVVAYQYPDGEIDNLFHDN